MGWLRVSHDADRAAKQLLNADLSKVRTSESRRSALRSLATLVADGTLEWEQPMEHERLRKILLSIPGIGPWTAEYVTMHGFHDDDGFPATDYGLKQQLKLHPEVRCQESEAVACLCRNGPMERVRSLEVICV